jgi:hypothetical protein
MSVVFAGEDSEGEESDDDGWLDDVEDTPRAVDAPVTRAASLVPSPRGTPPRAFGDDDADADAVSRDAAARASLEGIAASASMMTDDSTRRTARGLETVSKETRREASILRSPRRSEETPLSDFDAPVASRLGHEERVSKPVDRTTRSQKRVTKAASVVRDASTRKHSVGKELGATFLDAAGAALRETSGSVQEISDATRRVQNSLWELAATGARPWVRVSNAARVPRDVYEKHDAPVA